MIKFCGRLKNAAKLRVVADSMTFHAHPCSTSLVQGFQNCGVRMLWEAKAACRNKCYGTWSFKLRLEVLIPRLSQSTSISACDKAKHWRQALRIFHATSRPVTVTFNTTSSACSKGLQWQWSTQLGNNYSCTMLHRSFGDAPRHNFGGTQLWQKPL